jgi:hypothetical protein
MLINNISHNNAGSTKTLVPDDISGLLGMIEMNGLKELQTSTGRGMGMMGKGKMKSPQSSL